MGKTTNQRIPRMDEMEQPQDFYDPDDAHLEPLNINTKGDRQIDQMLGQIPTKKTKPFQMTGRYQGRKARDQQEPSEGEEDQQEEEEQEEREDDQDDEMGLKELMSSKKVDMNLLEEKMRQINQEDQEFVKIKDEEKTNPNQSTALKNQLSLYQKLLQLRYHFERNFQEVKRFPHRVIPYSEQLNASAKKTELSTLKTIDVLYQTQKTMYQSTFKSELPAFGIIPTLASEVRHGQGVSEPEYIAERRLDIEGLYSQYQNTSSQWTKKVEESLIRWSNKTALLSQSRNNFQSLVMQTPVGQAQKIFSALDKVINKARLKRNTFKILFEEPATIKETSNPQIFDDQDFFHEISKTYQTKIQKEDEDGLLLNETRKFLLERNNRDGHEGKQVDRKASKHRKIRYNVHAKLLNFTASRENPFLLEARDQIVKNIFNSAPKDTEVDYLDF